MTDLAARLRAVVEERLTVARSATPHPYGGRRWEDRMTSRALGPEAARHITLNDPADVILACERDLAVLERHQAIHMAPPVACQTCCDRHGSNYQLQRPQSMDVAWPCPEVRDLATRYRVEVDG
jgi:hypothetical protein